MRATTLTTASLLFALSGSALAEDTTGSVLDAEPTASFYVRLGALHLRPNVDSSEVSLSNLAPFAQLALSEGPIAGSGVGAETATMPAAIVGYVLPVLDGQIRIETVLALPVELNLTAEGTLANESIAPFALGTVPTGVPALGKELGTATVLPPLLTAVYRFLPGGRVEPYLGAGAAAMFVLDAQVSNPVLTAVSKPTLEISNGYGFVAQAGLDARIKDRYYATLDIKMILGMSLDAKVRDIHVETPGLPLFESARVGDASVKVDFLPVIVTLAVGVNF